MEAFKAAYRGVDVLLVDDVQFLAEQGARPSRSSSTPSTRCTRPAPSSCSPPTGLPRDMDALEDRLRERFEAGLVCDVAPADRATRLTILRKRVRQDDVGERRPGGARADRRPRATRTSARSRAR